MLIIFLGSADNDNNEEQNKGIAGNDFNSKKKSRVE